jgi:hypothetical protein
VFVSLTIMRTPNTCELLTVWEKGISEPMYSRALLLLAAAYPESKYEDLAGLSIGRRDGCLLRLRERLFGSWLASIVCCPACGEKMELGFDVSDIRLESGGEPSSWLSLEIKGYEVLFKLPDSSDLAALALINVDSDQRRTALLKRCLTEARLNGKEQKPEDLPMEIVSAVMERMNREDPQADIKFSLECPGCGNRWLAPFDILSFLWSEIESWAKRILCEIHILARSYGWREADILNMSAIRRQAYLDMLGA